MDKGKVLSKNDYQVIVKNCNAYEGSDVVLYLESEYNDHISANPNFLTRLSEAQNNAYNHPDLSNVIMTIAWNKGSVSDPRVDLLNFIDDWIKYKQVRNSTQPIGKIPRQKNDLTMTELALQVYLNDEVLFDPRGDPDKKADKVAKENGFKAATSGLQLYERYKTILDTFNEWSRSDNDKIMKNRHDRIAKVLPMIKPGKHKVEAEKILKELYNKLN
ncbi:MAG: hypothetical protein K0B15_08955 [Lentimicrobium sp.]|nr:hypothetical protein [Lentimicrobium sp.]